MDNENFLDDIGSALNESCISYYGPNALGSRAGSNMTTALMKSLRGMYAVDTPITGINPYGMDMSIRGQIAKQAEITLLQRNYLLSKIDSISGHWIAHALKAIIASDGFNDLCSKYDIFIKYTDPDNLEKQQLFSSDIDKLLKRTGFLDILKDCVMCEGLDYCELFLSTPIELGYGIKYVADNMDTKEHIGIYKNMNLLGAIKFDITPKGLVRGKDFIKADEISHFLLGYQKIPLSISKNFNKKYNIPEKIRCAYPILTPVIDMIKQYDTLSNLQTALETIKATQPIVMGVGVSPDNDMTEIIKQLQEWGLTLNKNKNNIIDNIDTSDASQIMQSMYNILMIPYSVDEGVNALRQVAINFPNDNLSAVLDDLRRSIALAIGIPEQYIAVSRGGAKETKEDTIQNNPRYSKMLSMIQQSLAKGIVNFIFKHLKAKYTDESGILTKTIDKDKIEVLFKSSTNLNDKIEDEKLMFRAENMTSLVNVVDSIAGSPNIPAKVKGKNFLKYWRTQMEKNPYIRDVFEEIPEEEMQQMYGPEMPIQGGAEGGDMTALLQGMQGQEGGGAQAEPPKPQAPPNPIEQLQLNQSEPKPRPSKAEKDLNLDSGNV